MNPKDSNEDQTTSQNPNDDELKCPQIPLGGLNDIDSKALKREFVGDMKRDFMEPAIDSNETHRVIVDAQAVNNNETLNLIDILVEEQDDKIRRLMFAVCQTLQRGYGDIANSLIPQFIEFVGEHEFNVDHETLADELECTLSDSVFIDHFASEFPSVFGMDSEKQELQNLLSSCSKFLNKFRESISWSNIVESLKHEMCDAISTKMDGLVVDIESNQLIESSLQNRKLSDKEVTFQRSAVERARKFNAQSDDPWNSSVFVFTL